ncbi:MAG TPA: hypothetical protein VI387_09860 [Candidatus Brocadiales bacterium]|nr:hypothetical protein [Candidatus Brocadiales bacterium]
MRLFLLIVVILTSLSFGTSAAEIDPVEILFHVRALKCDFPKGTSADWKDGKLVLKDSKFESAFHFDSINLKDGKARLIGNTGSGDISVRATGEGLTFIEKTPSWNFNFTTIFPVFAHNTTEFIGVHSRHINLF